MEENPYKAPGKSFRHRTGNDAAFILFAVIAVIFGADGVFCAAISLVALVMGLIGAEMSTDITSYGLSLLAAIGAAIGLGIGAVAWAIARRFRE
ncbi:MAG TPA: hypothetical protein VG826_29740 [Pirellulales bacterium]|nr:hypothetical protein [Pirellulales bacterium]